MEQIAQFFADPGHAASTAEVAEMRKAFAAPRHWPSVAAFIHEDLPEGRYAVAGAGSHGTRLLDLLRQRNELEVLAFVDQRADQMQSLLDVPVIHPKALSGLDPDTILLSHTCRERDMAETLQPLGIPLQSIYEDPKYTTRALAALRQELEIDTLTPRDTLLIQAGRGAVLEPETLKTLFDPSNTQRVFIARADYRTDQDTGALDLHQSLDLLVEVIQRTQPKTIVLASAWFNNYMINVVRTLAPTSRLICEIFDWNILNDDGVRQFSGISRTTHRWNRSGEHRAVHEATAIVSKREAPFADLVTQANGAHYLTYYGGASEAPTHKHQQEEGPLKIVYAGILPAPDLMAAYQADYDFLPLFEALAASGNYDITLYNALDDGSTAFDPWRKRLNGRGLHYYARIPYATLLQRLPSFHLGWLASTTERTPPLDQHCLLPNRLIAYLAAGLPVVVDSGWSRCAQRVRETGAGIVLDDFDTQTVMRQLNGINRRTCRKGAATLAKQLTTVNHQTIHTLRDLCRKPQP